MDAEPFSQQGVAKPRNKMTRKSSISVFPLTPPQSSHSTSNIQTYTPPQSPIFSDLCPDTLTPASTPPRSYPSPFPMASQMPHILRFPGIPPDPDISSYYASNSSNPLTCTLNNDLLHVLTLLGPGAADPEILAEALKGADAVLARASQYELWDMVSKCHYYRGIIFIEMLSWKNARNAFTRAATIRSWGGWIDDNMKIIAWGEEMERRGLVWDMEDRARILSFMCSQAW
ncbi:hypothetical protein VTL71DRAFT_12996 [Oculimacula yallundae]|uniref:Uncharacterized protein n=1 Tax=Oculimacula yallundae TaxID=86028 RepID=A0ABR4CRD1_9HELO